MREDDRLVDEALTLVASEHLPDWFVIERAAHDGRSWFEPNAYGASFMTSARITNADVEGTAVEMRAIAEAIEDGQSAAFRRCAARRLPDGSYALGSPRNSLYAAIVPEARARELAATIREVLDRAPTETRA